MQAQYSFDAWTTENGLPHNSIRALLQTRDGYLWLTTGNGLVRFDGVKFRVFSTSNTAGLTSNRYTNFALWEDKQGVVWAGTMDGGVIRYQNGAFKAFTTNDGLPDNRVRRIDEDPEGTIWIFTQTGLAKWQHGNVVRVAPLAGSSFNDFLTTPTQQVGADAIYLGLWRQDSEGWHRFAYGRWSPFRLPPRSPPAKLVIASIIEDAKQRVWYSLRNRPGEYYCIANGRLSVYKGLPRGGFVSYGDRHGFLWLTDHEARTSVWKDGERKQLSGLSTPNFPRVLEDREGRLWVGTLDDGLYRLRQQVVTSFRHHAGPEFSTTLLARRNGDVWVGSLGLAQYHRGRFRVYFRKSFVRWAPNLVTALHADRDGTLWVGFREGVARFRGGRFVEDKSLSSEIKTHVRAIHRDRHGDVWLGCDNGLVRLSGGKLTRLTSADGLSSNHITVMLEDRHGKLWLGTRDGLSVLDSGRFSSLSEVKGQRIGEVASLYEDAEGFLWIGTYGRGLFRLKDGEATHYTAEQGLGNDAIFQILEDSQGFLWLGSQAGIIRVAKHELNDVASGTLAQVTSTRFGTADGLLSAECEPLGRPGGFKASDGTLWFSTIKGVAIVNPNNVPSRLNPPPVAIEECIIDQHQASCHDELSVNPDQVNLEIHYTALSSIQPEQIRFKYRLAGLDESWTEAGTRRAAYYSHLPPGEYRFQVIASQNNGVWSTEGKSLRVIIAAPFYATWWFRTLALVSAAALVVVAWKYRVSQIERAHTEQQAFSRQLIASQENERQRIAAELHDSLGQRLIVIKNLALMSLNGGSGNGATSERIGEISAEASEAISEVKAISYNLRPYQLDRMGLTKAVESVVRKTAAASHIAITAEIDQIDDIFPKELEINFYRIVQESLNNIVKHSEATQASVTVQADADRILLRVQDNGKGFIPGTMNTVSHYRGFGLTGIAERGQLLGGKTNIHSTPGHGTTISVEIALSGKTL